MKAAALRLGDIAEPHIAARPFTLPFNAAVQTFAIMGIRRSGKTSTACVLAEEMCKANLPWIALDPVGVWWGLRAAKNGKPGGYPVVVIGGQHGDLPLHKGAGAQIAEALVREPVCAVVDLSQESKRFWHTFVTDFCLRLMDLNPAVPRHLFVEEAPEFIPQRTKVDLTARCKEAVERLVRLGGNRGYGCTIISQRPATVDKDVLSVAPWMRSPVQIPKNNKHGGFSVGLRTMEEIWSLAARRAEVVKDGAVETLRLPKNSRLKTLCHRSGMGWWAPIRSVIRHPYSGPLVRLIQKWGEVVVTPNHSVYAVDGSLARPQDNPELLAIRAINQQHTRDDDSITLPAPDSNFKFDGDFFSPTGSGSPSRMMFKLGGDDLKSFLRFLGAWLSEGSVHQRRGRSGKRSGYIIQVANTDRGWLERRMTDLRVFAEPACKIYAAYKGPLRTKDCWNLVAQNKALGKWLEKNCGKGAEHKRLPDFVFGLKREYVNELLETLIDGDGHRYENGRWIYFTKSPELAQGLGLLLSLHGIGYTVGKSEKTGVYRLLQCDWYNHRDAEKRTMEEIPFDGYVYDLEIDDRYAHNFSIGVGNVVVHNSQCASLFVLRTVGPHDRKALDEWIGTKATSKEAVDWDGLPSLPSGMAYFWSPEWLRRMDRVQIRERETFHPGATREVGVAARPAEMSDVAGFVMALRAQILQAEAQDAARKRPIDLGSDAAGKRKMRTLWTIEKGTPDGGVAVVQNDPHVAELERQAAGLRQEVLAARAEAADAQRRLASVRKALEPQFLALKGLFDEIGNDPIGTVDRTIYEPWLAKAGRTGCRRFLELLIERRELTRDQLGTLAGVPATKSTFRAYMSWLKRNGLVDVKGETVRLRVV